MALETLDDTLKFLSKLDLKITVLTHASVDRAFKSSRADIIRSTNELLSSRNVSTKLNVSLDELIDLYDCNEYIVTDGSGTCYEAIVRGCKAVWHADLDYHDETMWGTLPFSRDAGLLPDVQLHDILRHPGNDHDMKLVNRIYGSSLVTGSIVSGLVSDVMKAFEV
jgi:hypothetical protein